MFRNLTKQLLLTTTVTIGILGHTFAANASTWTFSGNVTGSFDVDNENSPTPIVTINAPGITANSITFTQATLLATPPANPDVTTGGGITGITWVNATTFDTLFISFDTPLTPAGGSITLASGSDINGTALSGGVNAPVPPTSSVPFDFSIAPGLVVFGLITGVAKGRKHLPKIKKKLGQLFPKK